MAITIEDTMSDIGGGCQAQPYGPRRPGLGELACNIPPQIPACLHQDLRIRPASALHSAQGLGGISRRMIRTISAN